MKKILSLALFLSLFSFIKAQDPEVVDSVLTDLFFNDSDIYDLFDGDTNYHFLYFGTTLNNASYYAGREVGDNQFNTTAQMYYFISNGLYFGASGAWYSNMDPGFRTTVVTAGYANAPRWFEYLRYRLSYNRYIYLNMGSDFTPQYTADANIGLTLKYKWIGIRGEYSLVMGQNYASQFSADAFLKIKLLSLGKTDRIQFEPEISNFYGSELVEYDLNAHLQADPNYEPSIVYQEKSGWMNTQLSFPISVGYRNIDFEVAYIRHIPYSLDPAYYYDKSGTWRVTLAYYIPIL
jgi:hypothetical protein